MNPSLFDNKGHLKKFIYYPAAWTDAPNTYWLDGWEQKEKSLIIEHLRKCPQCREDEINAMLYYATHPFRPIDQGVTFLDPKKHNETAYKQIQTAYGSFDSFIEQAVNYIPQDILEEFDLCTLPTYISDKIKVLINH